MAPVVDLVDVAAKALAVNICLEIEVFYGAVVELVPGVAGLVDVDVGDIVTGLGVTHVDQYPH